MSDMVTMQVIRYGLEQLADEMGYTLVRTGRSTIITEIAAGGVAGGVREIYLEGLRLPMVKLYKAGREDREIVAIIANQVRLPEKTLGDIRAQVASLAVGVERLDRLYRRYGEATMRQACADLLDYSERRMRLGISALPAGTFESEDFLDDDGVGDTPIRVHVRVTVGGGRAVVDLTGSADQAEGNVNSTLANTHAAAYYVFLAVVDPGIPPNSGCYRPIEILTRPGSVVHPLPPGAVAARTNTSQKIVEAMLRALAPAVPARVTAGSHGQISTCGFGGRDPRTGAPFVYTDIQGGGSGARPNRDGRDGQDSHLPRFMNTPVEVVERQFPVRIERYAFIADSGGPGTYRGGLALRRDVRLLADRVSFARYGDRHRIAPQGLFGGLPGSCGAFVLNPGAPDERLLKSKGLDTLSKGDVVSVRLPGAGGYGAPRRRDRHAVIADLRDEKISRESACRDYGLEEDRG